jgi:hypothetical protein
MFIELWKMHDYVNPKLKHPPFPCTDSILKYYTKMHGFTEPNFVYMFISLLTILSINLKLTHIFHTDSVYKI